MYKVVTLIAVVGVDQSNDTFDDEVADRFCRRLPEHIPQVRRCRARYTPANMKSAGLSEERGARAQSRGQVPCECAVGNRG